MGELLETNKLQIPDTTTTFFGCAYDPLPYCDEIFPLKTYLMSPYPGSRLTEAKAIYNYRHFRARRAIENAFGILCSRWKIFLSVIHADVKNIAKIVMACLALHNYLKSDDNVTYCPVGFTDQDNATVKLLLDCGAAKFFQYVDKKDFQMSPPL